MSEHIRLKQEPSSLALESLAWVMLLVDRSSSMEAIHDATVDGLNTFVRSQKDQLNSRLSVVQFGTDNDGKLEMTTLFDTASRRTQSRSIERAEYRPYGSTPLFAAVMAAIARMEKHVRRQDRALLVIQTDGYENASKPITLAQVKARIAAKRALGNWTFAYLGAELEAWGTAESYGIDRFASLSWSPTDEGVRAAYRATSDAVTRWKGTPELTGPARFYPLQLPAPR